MSVPLQHWYRLGKKTFWLFLLRSGWFFILLFLGLCYLTYKILLTPYGDTFKQFFIDHSNWYLTGGFVLSMFWLIMLGYLIIVTLRGWVLYRQYKFMLDVNAFHVRRGIFFIKEIVIPYHHIQNVEIQQPYLYRLIGLAELDITTLGGNSMTAMELNSKKKKLKLLPIIDHRMAKALAQELIDRGSTKEKSFVVETEDDANQLTEIK